MEMNGTIERCRRQSKRRRKTTLKIDGDDRGLRDLVTVHVASADVVLRLRKPRVVKCGRGRGGAEIPLGAPARPCVHVERDGTSTTRNVPGEQDTSRDVGIAARNELIRDVRWCIGIEVWAHELLACSEGNQH